MMFTVNHIDNTGVETIESFQFVCYYPVGHTIEGRIVMEDLVYCYTDVIGQGRKWTDGKVYVMNEAGNTVAKYFLGK